MARSQSKAPPTQGIYDCTNHINFSLHLHILYGCISLSISLLLHVYMHLDMCAVIIVVAM